MRHLTVTICLSIAVLLGSVGVSESADFQKGLTAAQSGDFATALREWTPLAEQGNARAGTPKIILRPKPWDMTPNKDVKTDRKDLDFVSEYREIIREVFRQRSLPKLIELIGDKELEFGPRKNLLRDKYWHEVFSSQFTKEITENTDRHNFEAPRLVAGREGLFGFIERGTCGPECFVRLFFDTNPPLRNWQRVTSSVTGVLVE